MHFLNDLGYPGNRYNLIIIYRDFVEILYNNICFFELFIPKLYKRNFRLHSKIPES